MSFDGGSISLDLQVGRIFMPSERFRKHLRISLRTVMVLVLILGFILGWRVNKAREQRRAVAAVASYGGWVHYDYEFVGGKLTPGQELWAPVWLRRMLGDEYFREVAYVSLVYDYPGGKRQENANRKPCDELLAQLGSQTGLKQLLMQSTQATDEGLKLVGKMPALETLYIWDASSITDSGVAHLAGAKNLKIVYIGSSRVTDQGLVLLSRLPKIEELYLQAGHFSDEGFRHLKGQNTLTQLWTGIGDFQLTDTGLAHLKEFKKLAVIDLQFSRVTARGLEHLKGMPSLKEVYLSDTSISDSELKPFRQAMPGVTVHK
jgi:hypothetical protein